MINGHITCQLCGAVACLLDLCLLARKAVVVAMRQFVFLDTHNLNLIQVPVVSTRCNSRALIYMLYKTLSSGPWAAISGPTGISEGCTVGSVLGI